MIEQTLPQDPTGALGFQQLEQLLRSQRMDIAAVFFTIAMALEKKHCLPSSTAYSRALAAIDERPNLERQSEKRRAQWERCVIYQRLGKVCVDSEHHKDAIVLLEKSLDLPSGKAPEKILENVDFTGTPHSFRCNSHKLLSKAFFLQHKAGECGPEMIDYHVKKCREPEPSEETKEDNGSWDKLPVHRVFEYSWSGKEQKADIYIPVSLPSLSAVRVTQPDAKAIDIKWQKDGSEKWLHLCELDETVSEDTTVKLKKDKIVVTLYYTTSRMIRSTLVNSPTTCPHVKIRKPPPLEAASPNAAPAGPAPTIGETLSASSAHSPSPSIIPRTHLPEVSHREATSMSSTTSGGRALSESTVASSATLSTSSSLPPTSCSSSSHNVPLRPSPIPADTSSSQASRSSIAFTVASSAHAPSPSSSSPSKLRLSGKNNTVGQETTNETDTNSIKLHTEGCHDKKSSPSQKDKGGVGKGKDVVEELPWDREEAEEEKARQKKEPHSSMIFQPHPRGNEYKTEGSSGEGAAPISSTSEKDKGNNNNNNNNTEGRQGERTGIPEKDKGGCDWRPKKAVVEELPWDREEREKAACVPSAGDEVKRTENAKKSEEETSVEDEGKASSNTRSGRDKEKEKKGYVKEGAEWRERNKEQEEQEVEAKKISSGSDGPLAGCTLTRQGQTLIVRLPAESDLDLELKSDVLRVGSHGELRDIALGCSVDVNEYTAKKRRGMVEVTLTVI